MQTVESLLLVKGAVGSWATEFGKRAEIPEVAVGVGAKLVFDLRRSVYGDDGVALPVLPADVTSDAYYIALDADFDQTTAPKLLISTDITLQATAGAVRLEAVLPNTATPEILAALAKRKTVTLHGEIGGYSGDNGADNADFVIGFELTLRNRVYLGGAVPESTPESEYLTAVQVKALIAEATRSTTPGPPGTTPEIGENGNWWIGTVDTGVLARCADGDDGITPHIGENGNWFIDTVDTQIRAAGLNAYEVAVAAGYSGTVAGWLAALKGEPGQNLKPDATGELSELSAYDDEGKGFLFAAARTNAAAKTSTLYLYAKRSNTSGDWCDPCAITYYERHAEVKSLAALTFAAPTDDSDTLSYDLSASPNAFVAAVCIDTAEGEEQLPIGSALGVRKIVKTGAGVVKIQFGTQVPAYETGKIYLTQFLGLTDTPEEVETGRIYYGFVTDPTLTSVTGITAAHLAQLTEAAPGTMGKTSLGTIPAGSFAVVVVPAGFTAAKDDGFGGRVLFSENNALAGTGANGATVEGVGKVYGEFKLNTAELFFYVGQV